VACWSKPGHILNSNVWPKLASTLSCCFTLSTLYNLSPVSHLSWAYFLICLPKHVAKLLNILGYALVWLVLKFENKYC
jgi:hypothetical protein